MAKSVKTYETVGDFLVEKVEDMATVNAEQGGLLQTDIDDTPVDGVTTAPISSNWAYDKVVSDALELQRLKGIDLTQNSLLYLYNHNTKLVDDCETTWTAYNAGTIADETTIKKVGTKSQKFTADADTKGAYKAVALDLSKFLDGAAASENDYLQIPLYILTQDITDLGSAAIRIAFYDGTNEWYYDITAAMLENAWNFIQPQLSAFMGTANWDGITHVRCYIAGTPDAEVIWYLDDIQLYRKDPISANPNPFQIEVDGVMERVLEISSGTPFLGYDGTTLVVKGLAQTSLKSTFDFKDKIHFTSSAITSAVDSHYIKFAQESVKAGDGTYVYIQGDDIFASVRRNSSTAFTSSVFLVDAGDELTLNGYLTAISAYGYASKSGNSFPIYHKEANALNGEGVLQITMWADVSLTSFKCSSSPLMVNG